MLVDSLMLGNACRCYSISYQFYSNYIVVKVKSCVLHSSVRNVEATCAKRNSEVHRQVESCNV